MALFVLNKKIHNALTGQIYDKYVGSKDELDFYRVIPVGSTEKLFFENKEEYGRWRLKVYIEENNHIEENNKDRLYLDYLETPFSFYPAPLFQ
jgi:hypothetical protein